MTPQKNDPSQKAFYLRWGDVLIIPLACVFATLILFSLHPLAGGYGLFLTIFSAYHSYKMVEQKKEAAISAVENMDLHFEEITKNVIFSMPFPTAVLNQWGNFLWYNKEFKELFSIQDSKLGRPYTHIFEDISLSMLEDEAQNPLEISVEDQAYAFYHKRVEEASGSHLILLYGVNHTREKTLQERYQNRQPVLCTAFFDNYDEVIAQTAEQDRPLVLAEVDRLINRYANEYQAMVIKYEPERYFLVMTQENLDRAKGKRFHLLEEIKDIRGSNVTPTISMGIAYGESTPKDLWKESRQAIDIALARGGDQAVLKNGEQLDYFGGKNQVTQNFTRVKARVMSNTIHSFVEEADQVMIMGHQNADMDSLGSCLGMAWFVKNMKRQPYVVLDEVSSGIQNFYDYVSRELPEVNNIILSPEKAQEKLTAETLILVMDNHRHDSTTAPLLLDQGNRIIIVDHHRRGSDYIKTAEVAYIEPYASSASEMVTEMLSYMDEEVALPKAVAEGLLSGITVDTKDFFYQTGPRTFEAAAYLKTHGADSMIVKELFKDDFERTKFVSEAITTAKPFEGKTLISRFERDLPGSTLIASKAADALLGISGVRASFVLTYARKKTHISARSLGDVSVQLIMEKMGGGGHLTASATQLDMPMDQAEEKLKDAIRQYFQEEEEENESHSD